jgi:hypothetical protein
VRQVGFFELLCWPNHRVVEHGVAASAVTKIRFEETGHRRPLDPTWAPTFGRWGGVANVDELADLSGRTAERVRGYAKESGLRFAHKNLRRTHAELAIALWCDRSAPARDSCRRFGVWPGERRVLCAAAQILVDVTPGGIASVLKWPLVQLEARFAKLELRMQPPAEVLRLAVIHPSMAVPT